MDYFETFRSKRKTMGLTQEQLSNRTDCSTKTISNFENGKPITTPKLFVLMDGLNITFTDKENDDDTENNREKNND